MIAFLVLASALSTHACETADLVQRVHIVQTDLFTIYETEDDLPIDAPPLAQQKVPELRTALSAAITSYMQCDAAGIADIAALQPGLAKLLNANRPKSPAEQK